MGEFVLIDPLGVSHSYNTSKVGFVPVSGSGLTVFQEGGDAGHDYKTEALLIEKRVLQGDYYNPDVQRLSYSMGGELRLTGISLPGCTYVPILAFAGCSNLLYADFSACETIPGSAFQGCVKLSQIIFPAATIIGQSAFSEASNLVSLVLSSDLKYVGGMNFNQKSQFLSMYGRIPYFGTAVVASGWAGAGVAVYSSVISLRPDTTLIGASAFASRPNSSVTSIENTENVKYVNEFAFNTCSKLSFSEGAFPNCVSVGLSAFNDCILQSENNIGYVGDMAVRMYASSTTVSLRENTRVIADQLFVSGGGSRLTSIEGLDAVQHIGNYAFSNCKNLSGWGTFDFSGVVTIGNGAFNTARLPSIINLTNCEDIGTNAFAYCSAGGRKQLTTGSKVKRIRAGTFQSCSLQTISLPACTQIDEYAFRSNFWLTTVSLPECVTIGSSAFYQASYLASITLPKCEAIMGYAFYYCTSLKSVYFPGSSVVFLENSTAFPTSFWSSGRVYVPESLVSQYKADLVWGLYSSRIYSITE